MTIEQRHDCMSRVRSENSGPELKMRRALWHKGFRYWVNAQCLPGRPDIVLPRYSTAIFVHGCFWHGHKDCKYYTIPKTNTVFWMAKVARNQERDQEVWRKLEAKGWSVIIVWECQLKKVNLAETVEQVAEEIVQNGEAYQAAQEERKRAWEEYKRERRARKEKELLLLKETAKLAPSSVRQFWEETGDLTARVWEESWH